jgi:hypothetical protein
MNCPYFSVRHSTENGYKINVVQKRVWNGHLARQQARSLFHYLTINYGYLLMRLLEKCSVF